MLHLIPDAESTNMHGSEAKPVLMQKVREMVSE
jgi:hypothetical protein